jgi:hypothetical protein
LNDRFESLEAKIRALTKTTPPNEPPKRRGFVEQNYAEATRLAGGISAHETLLVLGLGCPIAVSLALLLTVGQDIDASAVPHDMEPTLWLVTPRQDIAAAYEKLWAGVSQTVGQLRAAPAYNARLILFVANGGTSSVVHPLGQDFHNPTTSA